MSHFKDIAIDEMNKLNISNSYLFKLRDSLGIINAIMDAPCNITVHDLSVFVENELERRFPSEDVA